MNVCEAEGCGRVQRARHLCEMHYGQLKRAGLGTLQRQKPRPPTALERDCQLGLNGSCVDCGDVPFGGGMRCLWCFQVRCDRRQVDLLAQGGPHYCLRHEPSLRCYKDCECRCDRCRECYSENRPVRRENGSVDALAA